MADSYLTTGGGKLYIRPIVDGEKQQMVYFGTTDTVTLSMDAEYVEHKSTEKATSVTDKKIAKSKTATINFTSAEISPENISRAYLGKTSTVSQEAGTDIAQTITGIKYATFYDMGVLKITSLTVKDESDTTTYTNGTDYSYDKNTGYIEFLSGGEIAEDANVNLTISYDAYEKTLIASLQGEQLEAELIFVSDPQSGEKYRYTFKKVSISSSGDFALKSDDFATLTYEGEALVDSSVTDPVLSDFFDVEVLPND